MPALSEDRLIRRLIKLVTELDLDRSDFVIFGSGPMLAHGLRESVRDLDIVARGDAWRRVAESGIPGAGAISGSPMAVFWGGRIQFFPEWISQDWDTDDLIHRAEPITVEGAGLVEVLLFAQLTDVLAYKQKLDRPKDRPDVDILHDLMFQPGRTHGLTTPRTNPGFVRTVRISRFRRRRLVLDAQWPAG
jgi:hypothetical protein